jgi:hypothetical protein
MKAKLLILTALLLVAMSVFPAAGAKIAGPIITPYGHTIINPVEPNGPIIVPYEKLAGPIITPYGPIIVPYDFA